MLHTYMDNLRDDAGRSINHHGKEIKLDGDAKVFKKTNKIMNGDEEIPTYQDMTQRDENAKVDAVREFYKKASFDINKLAIGEFAGSDCMNFTFIVQ